MEVIIQEHVCFCLEKLSVTQPTVITDAVRLDH